MIKKKKTPTAREQGLLDEALLAAVYEECGDGQGAQKARDLLRQAARPLGPRNAAGRDALMLAARKGLPDLVRLFLEAGADPKNRDIWGHSALGWAAIKGQLACMEILLPVSETNLAKGDREKDPLWLFIHNNWDEAGIGVLNLLLQKTDLSEEAGYGSKLLDDLGELSHQEWIAHAVKNEMGRRSAQAESEVLSGSLAEPSQARGHKGLTL